MPTVDMPVRFSVDKLPKLGFSHFCDSRGPFWPLIFNPWLTKGAIFCPLSFFRNISQSYKRIITKFSIPSKPLIWHILTKGKLDTSDTSTMTSDWRHVFPLLGRNKGLQETLPRKRLKRWNQMVFNRRLKMNGATKLLSRIFKISKILNFFGK